MKASNPSTKAHQRGTLDPFYSDLFELVKRLARMQLIVCPSSFTHTWESLVSPFFNPLEQFYEMLSNGVKFYDSHTIRRFQLIEHARNWIRGEPDKPLTLDIQTVVTGSINAWPPHIRVKVNLNYPNAIVDELTQWRNQAHEGLCEEFQRWTTENHKTFNDWFTEETRAFGEVIVGSFQNGLFTELPENFDYVHAVMDVLQEAGVPDDQILSTTAEYFLSSHLKDIPSIKVSSMLYAALARKAAGGQKRPPNRGMANDIEVLSVLLPFCDTMFVDKECHALLSEGPLSTELDYGTLLFSLNNKQDFLDYLGDIEKSAPHELITTVTELYGN